MNWRSLLVVVRYDLAYAGRSARGILFGVFYVMFWAWLLWKLGTGLSEFLARPGESGAFLDLVLSYMLDSELAGTIFRERPATLSAFFLIGLYTTPAFSIWGGSDQLASHIGSRHLRFIVPRCGRFELYLGRFLGSFLFVAAFTLLAGLGATILSLCIDDAASGAVLLHALRVNLTLVAYAAPFTALVAIFGALTAVPAVAAICAYGALLSVKIISGLLAIRIPAIGAVAYLFPNSLQTMLLGSDAGKVAGATALLFVYTAAYFAMGWLGFRRRNI